MYAPQCLLLHKLYSQDMEVSINRWMDKENVIHIYTHTTECNSAIQKNEILPFATRGYYAKWNKSDREK